MKNCYKCKIIKPTSEFCISRTRYDGLNSLCRECSKKKPKPKRKTPQRKTPQSSKYKKEKTLKKRLKMIELLGGKCLCCKMDDFRVLEFDHIKPIKKRNRGSACYESNPDILNLQLLCANCHRIKTYYPEEFTVTEGE